MKLALLGCDEQLLAVVRAAARQGDEVVWLHDAGEHAGELLRLAPRARQAADWEGLLAESDVEAVLVARGDEAVRGDQLRKLTQAGIPLLISHPIVASMLLYYELEMIRGEQQSVLTPCLPLRLHPAVVRLVELIGEERSEGMGRCEQLTLERTRNDRRREPVLRQFAHDVDVARAICGELNKLTATAPADMATRYASLNVQLTGPAGTAVRWSVEAEGEAGGLRLTLRGTRGKAQLELREQGGIVADSRLEITVDGATRNEDFPAWDSGAAALDLLKRAIARPAPRPDWIDASRSVELAETVDRSLLKARTIELHFEDYSEEATFKGTMTSLGCGLLLLGLVMLFVAAIAAQAGAAWAGYYLYALLGVLGLFLLLQLFKFVFPPR